MVCRSSQIQTSIDPGFAFVTSLVDRFVYAVNELMAPGGFLKLIRVKENVSRIIERPCAYSL